jgi:hypothetical protein
MRCSAYLAPEEDTPTLGAYLEAPFQRQGLLYFDYGLTFATVSYTGGLVAKPKPPTQGGSVAKQDRTAKAAPDQPLTHAYLEIYGINWQTYLRFGLTPRYLPDLLISVGLGVQTAAGRLKIFQTEYQRFVVQPDAFAEAELVVLRFATGALSGFIGKDQSLLGTAGTRLIDDNPEGQPLTDFHLALVSASAGVRLLFPF